MCDEKQRLDTIDKREAEEKALNKRADEIYEDRARTSDILESIYGDEADAHWFDCMFFKLMNSKSNIGEAAEAVEELRKLADNHAYQLAEKEDE